MFRAIFVLSLLAGIMAACNPGPPAPCTVSLEAEHPVVTITGETGQPQVRPLSQEQVTTSMADEETTTRYIVDRELAYESGNVYVVTGSVTYTAGEIRHYDLTIDGGRFYEPEFCVK